jgi:hypothetical protein
LYINEKGFQNILIYNTLVLVKIESNIKLGSSFGESQMHGTERDKRDIYTLLPTHRSDFLERNTISIAGLNSFEPLPEDKN